jgi:hypothetical protein
VAAPTFLEIEFSLGDEPVEVETAVWSCGGRATTLSSTSSALGIQLVSSYLADDDLREVMAIEAFEPPGQVAACLANRRIPAVAGTATYLRTVLLGDHLERFVELAANAGVAGLHYWRSEDAARLFAAA